MERSRIRDELHKNVSQKLLGAAFGCKLLAGKIEELDKVSHNRLPILPSC
jgi:hypothetical protein